jgi:hypothetical protein
VSVNQAAAILTSCLQQLNQLPDIQASSTHAPGDGAESHLTICSPMQCVDYLCEVTSTVKRESLGAVLSQLENLRHHYHQPPLLLVKYLPDPLIESFVTEGIEFVDTLGNIYLNSRAAYILVRGNRLPKTEVSNKSAFTPAGLQLIYILLRDPKLLSTKYRSLAELTGISLGAISSAIQNLDNSGYLQRQKGGGYRITDYHKLLSFWELGYAEKLRERLLVGTFTGGTNRSFEELTKEILNRAIVGDYAIGGELGAAIATDYLNPTRVTLHVKDSRQVILQLRLRPDPQGEVTILQQFGTQNAWVGDSSNFLVDPVLMRGELLVENNSRLRETAALLFERFITQRSDDIS